MMKDNLLKELLDYIGSDTRWVFVDEYQGWCLSNIELRGFQYFSVREGTALRADTGETFELQYTSLRRGNHLRAQYRSSDKKTKITSVEKEVILKEVFGETPTVIITVGEKLYGFAPMFDDKLDLANFIRDLRLWGEGKSSTEFQKFGLRSIIEDSIALAKFLYNNNPNKKDSVLDEL